MMTYNYKKRGGAQIVIESCPSPEQLKGRKVEGGGLRKEKGWDGE